MERKRPKIEPIRNPTLFEMEKLEQAAKLTSELKVERRFSEPGIYLGTSAFTANGWPGSFYPVRMKPRDFLSYYATQFATVEVDSTYLSHPLSLYGSRMECDGPVRLYLRREGA